MNLSNLDDRTLVTMYKNRVSRKDVVETLYHRYTRLRHKQWNVLRTQMQNSAAVHTLKDDFYSDARITIYSALDAISIDKIRDDNWKFLGYYRFYLMSLRNRYIAGLRKKIGNEASLFVPGADGAEFNRLDATVTVEHHATNPERLYLEKEDEDRVRRVVATAMASWTPTKRKIFSARENGRSRSAIARELGVTPATITYHMQQMQKEVHALLREY